MHLLYPTGLLKLSFRSNWVRKTNSSIYEISNMLFSKMDFTFDHFANFNFAHLEIEESFCWICVKLQNACFHLQISISGIYKVLVPRMGYIIAHFLYKESFRQIWVKITEWSIRFKKFHFGAHFTNYGVPFCLSWIQKRLFLYFGKIYRIQGFSFV